MGKRKSKRQQQEQGEYVLLPAEEVERLLRRDGLQVSGDGVQISGDAVGGSVYTYDHDGEIIFPLETPEEKNGLIFAIERLATFVFSLFVGGLVLLVFIGGIGAMIGGQGGAAVGGAIALLLAFAMALAAAGNVSRRRSPL